MKVLQNTSSLSKLYWELIKRPSGSDEVDILGTLHSTIRGLWKYEAVVDSWPDFSAIVLRPLQLVPRHSKYQEVYIYGNLESLKMLLLDKNTLPWNECMTFRACPVILRPALIEAAKHHDGFLLDVDACYERIIMPDYNSSTVDCRKITPPEGFIVTKILEKDAAFVLQCWNRFAEESNYGPANLESIKHLIREGVTSCLYTSDGKPVSWIAQHYSGALILAYTLPEYRKKRMPLYADWHLRQQVDDLGQYPVHSIAAVGYSKVQKLTKMHSKTIPGNVTYYHFIPNQKNLKSKI